VVETEERTISTPADTLHLGTLEYIANVHQALTVAYITSNQHEEHWLRHQEPVRCSTKVTCHSPRAIRRSN